MASPDNSITQIALPCRRGQKHHFTSGTHTCWRAPQHDGKQGPKGRWVCNWAVFVHFLWGKGMCIHQGPERATYLNDLRSIEMVYQFLFQYRTRCQRAHSTVLQFIRNCAHSHIWDDHIRMSDLSDLIQNENLELFSYIPASMDWNYSFNYSIYKVFIHKSTC